MESIDRLLVEFRTILTKLKNPQKAKREKAYLKSKYDFYGVSYIELDRIVKDFRKKNPTLEKNRLFKLVNKLWYSSYHEEKTLAIKLLKAYSSYLSLKDMSLIEEMLEESLGWDHVDEISCHLVYAILAKNKKAFEYLKKWSSSDNFWMRRASIISQILLFRDGKGDKELFFEIARRLLCEKEFFIRKAIGWTLREMSKSDPIAVSKFLRKYKDKVSGLTLREGSRQLPLTLKKELVKE